MENISQAQSPAPGPSAHPSITAADNSPSPSFTLSGDESQDHPPAELLASGSGPASDAENDSTTPSDALSPLALPGIKIHLRCHCRSTSPSVTNKAKRAKCLKICLRTQQQIDRILLEDYADRASFKLARLLSQKAGITKGVFPTMYEGELNDVERDIEQAKMNCESVVERRNGLVEGVKGKFVGHGVKYRGADGDVEVNGDEEGVEKLERPEWRVEDAKGEIVHPETNWNHQILLVPYPKAEGVESQVVWQ